jgi:hypothetical protein
MRSATLAGAVALAVSGACPALAQVDCKPRDWTNKLVYCYFQADGNPHVLMVTSTFGSDSNSSFAHMGNILYITPLSPDGRPDYGQMIDGIYLGPLGSKTTESRKETAVLRCNLNFTGKAGSTYEVSVGHTFQNMSYVSTSLEIK